MGKRTEIRREPGGMVMDCYGAYEDRVLAAAEAFITVCEDDGEICPVLLQRYRELQPRVAPHCEAELLRQGRENK